MYLHRETQEECGLDVTNLDKVGVLLFEFVNEPQFLEVHVFRTTRFSGEVTESEGRDLKCQTLTVLSIDIKYLHVYS